METEDKSAITKQHVAAISSPADNGLLFHSILLKLSGDMEQLNNKVDQLFSKLGEDFIEPKLNSAHSESPKRRLSMKRTSITSSMEQTFRLLEENNQTVPPDVNPNIPFGMYDSV